MSFENSVKVICFYTANTPYQQEVIDLKESCAAFDIPITIVYRKSPLSKPRFILEKMGAEKCPLLLVDPGAIFLQKPDFAQFAGIDFSVRFLQLLQKAPDHAIHTATLFINHTDEARGLIQKWAERYEMHDLKKAFAEELSLYEVLLENKFAKVFPLPANYCMLPEIDTFLKSEDQVVIKRKQTTKFA